MPTPGDSLRTVESQPQGEQGNLADRWLTGLARAIDDRHGLKPYLLDWYDEDAAPTAEELELHVRGLRYLQDGIAKLTPESVLLLSIG